jgi:flagellar hook-associated protein FlgK
MMDTLSNALSAMRAHTRKMLVHANNIANVQSEGYRPQTATIESSGQSGVTARVETSTDPNAGVSLEEETVGMMSSEKAIQANLAVLKTSDKTLGVLIDIVS